MKYFVMLSLLVEYRLLVVSFPHSLLLPSTAKEGRIALVSFLLLFIQTIGE